MFLQSVTPYVTDYILFLQNIAVPIRVSYKCLFMDHREDRTDLLCLLTQDNNNPEITAVTEVKC